jgi:hypothetical protein
MMAQRFSNLNTIVHQLRAGCLIMALFTLVPSVAEAARSSDNRENKTISATLGAHGLSAGIFATRNFLLEGSYNYQQDEDVEWRNTYKVRGRHFLGNSFYGSLGMDYERRNAPPREVAGSDSPANEFLLATGALGNQWQWSAFTLGVDWVEIRVPVSRKVNAQLPNAVRARSSPTILGGTEIEVFNFYAGISI